jgi:hypothetical protein
VQHESLAVGFGEFIRPHLHRNFIQAVEGHGAEFCEDMRPRMQRRCFAAGTKLSLAQRPPARLCELLQGDAGVRPSAQASSSDALDMTNVSYDKSFVFIAGG